VTDWLSDWFSFVPQIIPNSVSIPFIKCYSPILAGLL